MEQNRNTGEDDPKMDVKGKGKGKGKENERPPSPPLVPPTQFDSFETTDSSPQPEPAYSRLVSSATSLTSSLMNGRAYGQYDSNILPSGKAESSGTLQRSSIALRETAQVNHESLTNTLSTLGTTFRSKAGQDMVFSEENNFSTFLGTTTNANGELVGSDPHQDDESQHLPHSAAAAMSDGSELVDLLGKGPVLEDYDDELHMTSEELRALRNSLFGEKLSGSTWDDELNFVPGFISNGGSCEDHYQLAQHLGVSDAAEARDVWLSHWDKVLTSYTDEVWGDLSHLVITARQELQDIWKSPEGTTKHGLDAVRRLQQILAHVRGS